MTMPIPNRLHLRHPLLPHLNMRTLQRLKHALLKEPFVRIRTAGFLETGDPDVEVGVVGVLVGGAVGFLAVGS